MKFYPRLNMYKAANVTFNPDTLEAYSYRWWRFVEVVNGKVVFNNYRYSVSTARHQSKVRSLLSQLGITIDVTIECPEGLQSAYAIESAISLYQARIDTLTAEMNKLSTRKAKNAERATDIKALKAQIKLIQSLFKKRIVQEAA